MEIKNRIKELINILNLASKKYYQEDTEIISNLEYDKLYDELVLLERESGIIFANSPTQKVGYEIVSNLPKKAHKKPMLSLNKTKNVSELVEFLDNNDGILSWKLDGLTVVLTYKNGILVEALTRGNGIEGEIITQNAKTFENLPINIPFDGDLIVRGEAVINYSDFNNINDSLPNDEEKYKNPRNLCSGSVRQLNSQITANRHVNFYVFSVVEAGNMNFNNSHYEAFKFVKNLGFDVVEHYRVNKSNINEYVNIFSQNILTYNIPSDGLVLLYDNISLGESLGETAKFPRNAIAFKWKDEEVETTLIDVKWNTSRTGLINPVAIFEPIEIDGTTVSKASIHNISILKSLKLGYQDRVMVYKANMIIPQISKNLTCSDNIKIPSVCPSCKADTEIKILNSTEELYCTNKYCFEKLLRYLEHFVSKSAMNIDGLSKKKLEQFYHAGIVTKPIDIYKLKDRKEEILALPNFGEKSYENIITSVDKSRETDLAHLINSLGIDGIGFQNAKILSKKFNYSLSDIMSANFDTLISIDGLGDILADNLISYFNDKDNLNFINNLLKEINLKDEVVATNTSLLSNKTVVITGKLYKFSNRDSLINELEKLNVHVTSSISKNTNYLVNNDINSTSSKNKKAKDLGIPIISEDDLISLMK